ncbi:MAG TPA: hypothetical protein VFB38_24855 [Chthonomonadaceae bacterium]|nr:hypothetical protein [Chthonomonadaceae bacterium]
MSKMLELPDDIYEDVLEAAKNEGKTPAEWIATRLPPLVDSNGALRRVPYPIYKQMERLAPRLGKTVDQLAAEFLQRFRGSKLPPDVSEEEWEAARARLCRHAGAVSLGYPTGADNENIDADLAREYGSTHEEEA